jgi:hypothetical protein
MFQIRSAYSRGVGDRQFGIVPEPDSQQNWWALQNPERDLTPRLFTDRCERRRPPVPAMGEGVAPARSWSPPVLRHSITSSARARREVGTVRPSALAVFRLMMSSNFSIVHGRRRSFTFESGQLVRERKPRSPQPAKCAPSRQNAPLCDDRAAASNGSTQARQLRRMQRRARRSDLRHYRAADSVLNNKVGGMSARCDEPEFNMPRGNV